MTGPDNDKVLISRIARGDQLAIRSLFARYQLRIFRFILRLVKSEAIAEELTNEVFLEIWRNAARFEGRSSTSTWILTIARNKALSSLRKRQEKPMDDKMADHLRDGADSPEITTQKNDKGEIMRECLKSLSPEHAEIIDLVYYHEKTISEVSEILGIPGNTVKTRMFYARKKLSVIMRGAGIDRGWP
ncbi:MAG TPA: sigma-70 family RNA polymerase sigma factor [Rhizobiales bacterium]|nr:sigma-70 family RNA polymerase sigma factor [Hyphomicrobiales bacterium]